MIPLSKAVLCVSCECITDSTNACQSCGSIAVISLANILNRKSETPYESDITSLMEIVDKALLDAELAGGVR